MPDGPDLSVGLDVLIDIHESLLRHTWEERKSDRDVLLLGDLRFPEFGRVAREHLGDDTVDGFLASAASTGRSSWMVIGKSPDFIGDLRRSGGFMNPSLAGSLDAIARAAAGLVPLLVVSPRRASVTGWAPPGSDVSARQLAAELAHEAN
jgi:hypothetical protein